MKYNLLLTSILFFLGLSNIFGQRFEVIQEKVIASEDGLEAREVLQLDRDQNGQYWFLNGGKLQEYDGDQFIATLGNDLPANISKFSLFKNEVFALTGGALYQLINDEERFKEHPVIQKNVRDILSIENELFVFCAEDEYGKKGAEGKLIKRENLHSIYRYDIADDSFNLVHEFTDTLSYNTFTKNASKWIFLVDSSLRINQDKTHQLIQLDYIKSTVNSYPTILFTTKKGKTYFSFRDGYGYYKLLSDKTIVHVPSDKQLIKIREDLQSNIILLFGVTSDERVKEMQILNKEDSIINLPNVLERNEFLLDVYSEDVYNELLCSSHNGIYHYKFNNSGILKFGQNPARNKSEFGAMTRYVYGNKDSSIFYINETSGLYQMSSDEVHAVNRLDNIQRNKGYTRTYYDPKTDLSWILEFQGREGSILSYDHKNNTFTKFPCRGRTEDVKRYDEDHLVIVGYFIKNNVRNRRYGYVTLLNTKTKEQRHMEFGRDTVFRSVLVKDGLWLGTSNKGLFKLPAFNERTGLKTIELTEGVEVKSIEAIDGSLFLSTYGNGLLNLDLSGNLLKQADINNSLNNNQVAGVVKDYKGNFWVSTFNGIDLINKDFKNITHLSAKDGLPSHEFNGGSYCSINGQIYFGSINGVCQIDPKIFYESYIPEGYFITALRSIKNNNELLFSKSDNTYSVQGIPDQIRFNLREFGFTESKDFNILKKLEVYTQPNIGEIIREGNEIVINNPKQGTFAFIAKNRKSTEDEFELATLEIQRNWDQILQNLLIAILTLAISFFVARQIIRRNNKLAQERTDLNQRIAETKLEALRSQMNPHFIFNSLGAIQYYIQNNEKNIAAKYLSKFAKLMRQFLEASKHERVSLHDEIETLSLYLELEKLRFEDKFEYEIDVDEDIDLYDFEIPSMLIQPFIENALLHGVNHLETRQGLIQMSIDKVKGGILCVVDDNGVGRAKTEEIQKRSVKKHKSRATQIINERLAVLKKDDDLEIEIKYIDKLDNEGRGLGTMVKIFIPS